MTSGEKVALSLLAEICKLKAEQAEAMASDWQKHSAPDAANGQNPDYQHGYFKGVEFATRCFEKRLSELVGE